MKSVAEKIAFWVTECQDLEFDFTYEGAEQETSRWKIDPDKPTVYCPKRQSFTSRLSTSPSDHPTNIIGTYGVPTDAVIGHLNQLIPNQPLHFFGDLDGPDLMTYAMLADRLTDRRVRYLGISDALLDTFSLSIDTINDRYFIKASPAEADAIQTLIKMGVPVQNIVGEQCFAFLQSGRKLEIEGLLWELPADELLRRVAP